MRSQGTLVCAALALAGCNDDQVTPPPREAVLGQGSLPLPILAERIVGTQVDLRSPRL